MSKYVTVADRRAKRERAIHARKCVEALKGLDPAAVAGVVAYMEVAATERDTENMGHADALDLIEDLRILATGALAALRGGK